MENRSSFKDFLSYFSYARYFAGSLKFREKKKKKERNGTLPPAQGENSPAMKSQASNYAAERGMLKGDLRSLRGSHEGSDEN